MDVDLEKFFDRVNHDILMGRLGKRIGDAATLRLIRAYLDAGIMGDGVMLERYQGTPQGGPLSPLLANVLLDEVDREKAGARVMALLRRLYARLRLTVNETKSAVASVFGRKFLGYGLWVAKGGEIKRRVADKTCWDGKPTSDWRKPPGSGASWTSGCVIGCGRSSSSTGSAVRRCTAN